MANIDTTNFSSNGIVVKISDTPTPLLKINEIAVQRLQEPPKDSSTCFLVIKVVLFPLTILVYLIYKLFSKVASELGLGTQAETMIDNKKRESLLKLNGQQISFGFHNKPAVEGMFFQAEKPNPNPKTILLCLGSHRSFEHYAIPMVKSLLGMGHNVLAFNYQGFGLSEGTKSEEAVYDSTEAAYQYLIQIKKCTNPDIVAWGYSLGSGAVCDLATKYNIDIVIDRGFSSMSQVAYQEAPTGLKNFTRFFFAIGAHFDNLKKLKKVKGRILIAQGDKDWGQCEKLHGWPLHKAATSSKNPTTYLLVDSAHMHTDDHVWFGEESSEPQESLA